MTTEIVEHYSEIVSKTNFLTDLNIGNAKKDSPVDNGTTEFIEYLENLRIESSGNLLIGHLNMNSIRNKVSMLSYTTRNKIDILIISESKLDDTFPTSQILT